MFTEDNNAPTRVIWIRKGFGRQTRHKRPANLWLPWDTHGSSASNERKLADLLS
ncbi:hypothetical protein F9C07_12302 [Aspergillus flavus]|uniref:Uncharacterized protein n=1 Tax=Aspergillus flavus (strain ATCC 200026 / FGSC A1120 / IAM 13836 / NRRL 3357 / JCM 12722 / SRRC 167) TaxID=332952 RepID=A0A7U2MYR5_ASPFN|nr:hypothetical protein F9C07_12302 [Aspergillus flavus]